MISVACRAECEEAVIVSIGEHYDEFLKCSDAYDTASISAKKTIVSRIIDRVDILRDYQLKIKLNISIKQFLVSLKDISTKDRPSA